MSAYRVKRVQAALSGENSLTAAIRDAGFHSSGRLYETSNATLGMTPSRFRNGAASGCSKNAIARGAGETQQKSLEDDWADFERSGGQKVRRLMDIKCKRSRDRSTRLRS